MNATVAPDRASAPWHLWVIGLVSLCWHGFGGYDYIQSQIGNREYIASMTEPFGYDADAAVAYFQSFPLWADTAWALGVWGSVAGSVLLLLRSRFALHAFVVSLVGMLAGMGYQFMNPLPGAGTSAVAIGFTLLVLAVMLLLIWYTKRMTLVGVLR
jgi:hypothetical protein